MKCKAGLHSACDSCGECSRCNAWISVKDRLPHEYNVLLVLCANGRHVARFPDGIDKPGIVGGWESCNYCGGENQVTFDTPQTHQQLITHWMPLPEARDGMD